MQQAPFQMKCLITYYTVLPKYTLNAHKLCGRAATVVATFALACSLPEERKVLCRLQISLSDQNNVSFGTPAQTLQTKKGGSFLISFQITNSNSVPAEEGQTHN